MITILKMYRSLKIAVKAAIDSTGIRNSYFSYLVSDDEFQWKSLPEANVFKTIHLESVK